MAIKSAAANNEVFLQGTYLGIGINADGTLGSTKAAPTGLASDTATGLTRVGMIADLDGFGVGNKMVLNDVLLQGRAIEGFNIGYKTGGKTFVQSNLLLTGYSEVDGTLTNTSEKGVASASWNGQTTEKLAVSQKISLADDAKYIRIDVTLTNQSGAAMNDVRYMRSFDPDQSDKYATTNKIESQGVEGALVSAYLNATNPFFLYSNDDRAVASFYGFVNTDPYAAAAYDKAQAKGYTAKADQTLNLTFGLGTLGAGASTTITLYMGVTDNLKATIAQIDSREGATTPPRPVVNDAPDAVNDSFSLKQDASVTGNVLANDRDANGDALTALLKSGPANGTVSFSADGSFVYTAKAGFSGTDSFSYTASDGKATDVATVTLSIEAAPVVPPVVVPPVVTDLAGRAGTVVGTSSASETLSGKVGANSFFFDEGVTGNDRIVNFEKNDVLVFDKMLYDGNKDGIIALSGNVVSIDAPKSGDMLKIDGVSALRFLGIDDAGHAVYGDASVRPRGAKESTLADNTFSGDKGDKKKDVFFFDTALGADLGSDTINLFGKRDLIATTTKLADGNNDGIVTGDGGLFALGDGLGSIALKGSAGAAVSSIEFDGTVVRDNVTYYVYSLVGSTGTDASDLGF
ncbi:Ig-like domain-containing protein [Sphingomonas yantingensis]|uniref:RapA2 cadherin-like domain-containing protein n=1 Tax=Sphingomonas yantingensis TaxID=1241761 RepID=A0A7W9EIL8_9SPHN|nr:Ig-like domain-containing protein [Sphingomonas yantingensis]MBB5699328.1 hypothetical protein [Sphingomonas yantingensis]